MTLRLLARSTIFRTISFRHNTTTLKSIQTSDQKTQNQRSSIPFYNWLKKTVTPPTQAFHHWAPNITSPVPRIKSLVPAMTVPTIAKACAAGGALAGTAVVLSLNAKTGLILAPLAGVVVLTYVLQEMVSNTFKMGKNAASIASSLTTVTSGLAQTATVLNTIAPPLAVALQTTGQLQELSVVNGDTKKQKSALHRQRISAGLWSTRVLNQTMLGSSLKSQMGAWVLMCAMALVTSSATKTKYPRLNQVRKKAAAASNTAIEVVSVGNLGYQVAQSTQSPVTGAVVAGAGAVTAVFSSALVKFENRSAQKMQAGARKVTDLMVKITNTASLGMYIGKYSPTIGTIVGIVSCVVSLCAFAKTNGVFLGMKAAFSRITNSSKQTQVDATSKQKKTPKARVEQATARRRQAVNIASRLSGKKDVLELASHFHKDKGQRDKPFDPKQYVLDWDHKL